MTLQGLFRNPLADPGLVGVSTGAATAAAAFIVLGWPLTAYLPAPLLRHALPIAAFCGGLLTTILIYGVATREGRTDVATLLLAGVAINAMAAAAIGLLIFLSSERELRDLNFWMLGSLNGVTWERLAFVGPLILAADRRAHAVRADAERPAAGRDRSAPSGIRCRARQAPDDRPGRA